MLFKHLDWDAVFSQDTHFHPHDWQSLQESLF